MNFKPTLLKLIVSILIGLTSGYYFSKAGFGVVFDLTQFLVGFTLLLIIIYTIYSLFQKKK